MTCLPFLPLTSLALFLTITTIIFPSGANSKCVPGNCCDINVKFCRTWAAFGECRRNAKWMALNCQTSCGTCHTNKPPSLGIIPALVPSNRIPSLARLLPIVSSPPPPPSLPPPPPPPPPPISSFSTSCEAIAQRPENTLGQLAKSGLLNPIEDISARQTLALDDISSAAKGSCVPELTSADCSPSLCFHLAYRTFDGVCNNLKRPLLGASFRHYMRHLPAQYENGFSEPIAFSRPSPREASRLLLASPPPINHGQFNSLLMQFGQFISHDVARTTLQPTANCASCEPVPGKCVPVKITQKDTNSGFKSKGCIKIARSAPVCGTGQPGRQREQLNENTAFIDGSQIYGSSSKDVHKFRDGRTGMLKLSLFNDMLVLPFDQSSCVSATSCAATFTAGDVRVNLFLGLSAMHILFAREHNRIVRLLQSLNPAWSGDRLFQEARKIVGAEIQAILYNEFLPRILGSTFHQLVGIYAGYAPSVDPTISNEFTTSAYRFGHGMILEQYPRLADNGQSILAGHFQFGDGVFKSQKILFEGGIDPILRGLWNSPIKNPTQMTPAITERMFGSTDLGSLNIMRGRDNGIPSFNKLRRFCGLPPIAQFDQLSPGNGRTLEAIYASTDDLDFYVGGMLERHESGGLVGQTFACIIGDQFKRSRDGDRFYFENPGIFTPSQLAEIKKISLARILCDNGDRIREVPAQAFSLPWAGGNPSACGTIGRIDLSKWREG